MIIFIIVFLVILGGVLAFAMKGGGDGGGDGGGGGGGGGGTNIYELSDGETFTYQSSLSYTKTIKTSLTTDLLVINYNTSDLTENMDGVGEVLTSLISDSNISGKYIVNVYLGVFSGTTAGLHYSNTIYIGTTTSTHNFNGINYGVSGRYRSVLLHELFHDFGIDERNDFSGTCVTSGYQQVVIGKYPNTVVNYGPPIEDGGGIGTVNKHFEENSAEGKYVFPNELMTGWLNTDNYLTEMTSGVLKDIGFGINDSSPYIFKNYNDINFVGSPPS